MTELLETRARWRRLDAAGTVPVLRVTLLSTYTADPLVPYLGTGLHDGGLPAAVTVGPFGQVMQQVLDDTSRVAAGRPDVLVLLARPEEIGDELVPLADAAAAACARWRSALVFVLPSIPEARPYGAGDAGAADGTVATATAAREAARRLLAGRPNVLVADAEESVRAIGTRQAYHPSLFRFAKIPYTEEVFADLGGRIARLLALRYGETPRRVLLDVAELLAGPEAAAVPDLVALLAGTGRRLSVRVGAAGHAAFLLAGLPAGIDWTGADAGEARGEDTVLVTPDPAAGGVTLPPGPESWPAAVTAAGLLDRLPPVTPAPPPATAPPPAPEAAPADGQSRDEFVAGLGVTVSCEPVRHAIAAEVTELVDRANDFTLADPRPDTDPASPGRTLLAVSVRDRLGDYGVGAAVGFRVDGDRCELDVFSVSCPVLGKGVEAAVLRTVADRAAAAGCDTVVVRYRRTPHNGVAAAFLAATGGTVRTTDGRQLRLHAVEVTGP